MPQKAHVRVLLREHLECESGIDVIVVLLEDLGYFLEKAENWRNGTVLGDAEVLSPKRKRSPVTDRQND